MTCAFCGVFAGNPLAGFGLGGATFSGLGCAGMSTGELQQMYLSQYLSQAALQNMPRPKSKLQLAQEYAAEVRKRKFMVKRLDNVEGK